MVWIPGVSLPSRRLHVGIARKLLSKFAHSYAYLTSKRFRNESALATIGTRSDHQKVNGIRWIRIETTII